MAGVRELAALMKGLEERLIVCMRCGICQASCPLFEQTGIEADVARGKLALLDGLLREMFRNPAGVRERLNRCLLCGSCEADCPSGVRVLEIFIKARVILTGYMGLSPAKMVILRGVLAHPRVFDLVMRLGARLQRLFTRPADRLLGTSSAGVFSPLIGNRHFVPLAAIPFHREAPHLDTATGRSGIRAAFFVGCLIDRIYPRVARAALDVLSHHGVGVFMPRGQGCCGIPALSSGDRETFYRLMRHNIERFAPEDFHYLVTPCASCASTIRRIWPSMAGEGPEEIRAAVAGIAEKTMDINRFLVERVGLVSSAPGGENGAVPTAYHDPCHLKKSLGVSVEPRALIRANPRYRLTEMTGADRCCGMGGSFNLMHYDLSASIGRRKLDNIRASGCSVVATGCPACMMQLSDTISRGGGGIAVMHTVEIYSELLRDR